MVEQQPRQLPLFPLNTVLFPRMTLPLRIFEPRYREMMSYCMERDRTFGVVLIKSGNEVGEPAMPFSVGTTAHIESIDTLSDGTLVVVTVGESRFLLHEMVQERPYQMGSVTLLEDNGRPLAVEAFAEIRTLAQRCLQRWLAANHQWIRDLALPTSQDALSYLIATRLPLDNQVKQELLECPTSAGRLEKERAFLVTQEEQLNQLIRDQVWLQGPSLN